VEQKEGGTKTEWFTKLELKDPRLRDTAESLAKESANAKKAAAAEVAEAATRDASAAAAKAKLYSSRPRLSDFSANVPKHLVEEVVVGPRSIGQVFSAVGLAAGRRTLLSGFLTRELLRSRIQMNPTIAGFEMCIHAM